MITCNFNIYMHDANYQLWSSAIYQEDISLLNSSSTSAAYMRQWSGPALVQPMAYRLFDAKASSKPMMVYCQLDSLEQLSVKFESESFSLKKMPLKLQSAKMTANLFRERLIKFLTWDILILKIHLCNSRKSYALWISIINTRKMHNH